ncbi:MAG: 4Fe-4S binding protein [Leptospiraceae bacterium]|nr:4Fe-4S binding protein [Leptospiraceae bacterium]
MDRKDFFSSGLQDLGRQAYRSPAGKWLDRNLQAMSNLLSPAWGFGISEAKPAPEAEESASIKKNRGYPRPPGALSDPVRFRKACTSCGDCIVACPHGSIFNIPDLYGPVLDPNHVACHLCADFPCIEACPEEALLPLEEGELPGFGRAEVHLEACLNHDRPRGARKCKACQDECPVEEVVSYNRKGMPSIEDHCTGCGICVEQCPSAAIRITW